MGADALKRIAGLVGDARLAAQPVPDLSGADGPQTIADGYAAQAALHRYLCDRTGSALVGWKVGATTTGMQKYLGVDGPAYGRILSTNMHENGATLAGAGFCNPGIECEIALRVGSDAEDKVYNRETISGIIDAVLPAIEIVENRYGDFLARGTPTLIADDFFHKACVLGTAVTDWRDIDLAAIAGRTRIDGTEKGSGTGADVMGHPLEAVAWLANTLANHGERLVAGQIVLTGSVAPVIWVDTPTASAEIELESLGAVRLEIS
jgi:2-keto-4-pentenoate hydratase